MANNNEKAAMKNKKSKVPAFLPLHWMMQKDGREHLCLWIFTPLSAIAKFPRAVRPIKHFIWQPTHWHSTSTHLNKHLTVFNTQPLHSSGWCTVLKQKYMQNILYIKQYISIWEMFQYITINVRTKYGYILIDYI